MSDTSKNSSRTEPRPGTGPLRIATLCAALPTLCGLGLFAFLRETRSSDLVEPGMWLIGLGAMLSIVGATCLATQARQPHPVAPPHRGRAALIALWLVANYPLAGVLVYQSIDLLSAVVLQVENRSGGPLEFFRLSGPGFHMEEAPFPRAGQVTVEFHPSHDGVLTYDLRLQSGELHSGTAIGYVTPGLGFQTSLTITPAGEVISGD
ncbi:MAG: hypothetical protein QF599_06730 [Planctomycetota bacterium]|nr:hypothetical protein [Planctomycetota bacterium]MDP6518496.1 hypothetical protein [Planctomycetota bacterium]MDP6955654.1 hypothetical protein [Planctomycetota bacterium]